MNRRLFLIALAPVLLLGAYLRLADLGGPALWLDEILHLEVTRSLAAEPWYHHLTGVREIKDGTENGALYYRLQIWGQRLLPGDTGVRLFPALVGLITLPLMAAVGRILGGRELALVATFLLAVSPLHVYFSREGRPYSLLMALALLLLYALLRRGSREGAWSAGLGCLLAAYSGLHALPLLLAFTFLAALGPWRAPDRGPFQRSLHLAPLVSGVLALVLAYGLYLTRSEINTPVLNLPQKQVELQKASQFLSPWSERSLEIFLASMTTSGHPDVLLTPRSWPLVALALLGLVSGWRRTDLWRTTGMFLLPAVLAIVALLSVGRWYGMRYTSAALPAFLLLTACGLLALARGLVSRLPGRRDGKDLRTAVVAGGLTLLFAGPNLEAAQRDPYRKLDWRGVARFIDAAALDGEVVIVPNGWPEICLRYYLRDLDTRVEIVNSWESVELAETAMAERPHGWLLTAGFQRSGEVKAWMQGFLPLLRRKEEELGLFFFPDKATLVESRFTGGKGTFFAERFAELGHRLELSATRFGVDAGDAIRGAILLGGDESLFLGRGWSGPETDPQGTSFRWAKGDHAVVVLPILPPRDVRLRIRARPFVYPGAPLQQVELWLGEHLLGQRDLPPGWSWLEAEVPAECWRDAVPLLQLRFAHSARPAEVLDGSGDRRFLSAAFDVIEVVRPNGS